MNSRGLSSGEDDFLYRTDARLQKHREQMGFDTPVVYCCDR